MKFDAYIEERVVRMAFELKMLLVIERWHLKRVRMVLPAQLRIMYERIPHEVFLIPKLNPFSRKISCVAGWVNEAMLIASRVNRI